MRLRRYWCLFPFFLCSPGFGAAKTDIVIFGNGDRLTGEVKSLERGRLRFNTDATDTISIEWDDVGHLTSNQNMQVETEAGVRLLGHLSRTDESGVVIVETRSGPVELELSRIVLMTPIEERGVNRLDVDVTAGFNFAKASEITQLHLGLDMDYRTETRIISLNVDSTTSDSESIDANQRQSLDLEWRGLRPNRWLIGGFLMLNRNDELGIDLRTSIGAGVGRILRQSNSVGLSLEGGLLLSRENVANSEPKEDTLEAFGSLNWDWFRYDSPELDLSTSLIVYPNLTDTGRVRGELDISLKWELIDDLFWELSFYDSYDSRPALEGAAENDFGINTSLGYDF